MEAPEVPTEHLHEELHHHAQHSSERWTMGVALSSALLAGLAALASLKAGHYANEAMTVQIESANTWSYFQSKSIKESQLKSKMEILSALGKPASEADTAKAAEYKEEKEKVQKKAEGLEHEAKHHLAHARGARAERHDVSGRHRHRRRFRAGETAAVLARQPGLWRRGHCFSGAVLAGDPGALTARARGSVTIW